ncbi:restriction endonuclease subunit S [Halomonas sp. BN3-1]|uniref:restriction endonuclease subunit S n=1 Tax=Halomonas sp. BN3-1 TaxID=2082393 RepID=UPI000D38943E|nr:restriction endonuclease subunit S [Halomonas sp. BN3-1]
MTFPKYPEYKDSGVEWLGEVPAHWVVKPLKRAIASVESGTSVNAADMPAAQGELGVLKTSCVYKGWFDWRENKTVNREDLGRVSCPVRENTLIVSRMNTPDLVGSAGLVIEAPAGIFLPDRLWQVSMQESCSLKYYHYFTRTPAYRDQVRIACAGTSSSMQNLGQDEFGAIWHPSPLMAEQQAIATFLDHETARIDALVEEQQRLIELLQEKRQAVISHAVTKGLDPDVPMKDSGVEWLGEVPAHWEVTPLKRAIASVQSGTSVNAADVPAAEGELGILKTSCVYKGWFDWRENKTVNQEDLGRVSCPIQAGTLIVSRMNTPDLVGSAGLVVEAPTGIFLPDRLWKVSLRRECIPKYFYYFTRSPAYRDQVKIACAGTSSSMQNLGQDEFGAIWHPGPPEQEQQAIAAFLDHETARLDALMKEGELGIKLLQERRSALISAAVTGKIDVRGWQPPEGSTAFTEATQTEMV